MGDIGDTEVTNRPDEWKIEQGLSGAQLPILDQTGPKTVAIEPRKYHKYIENEEGIKAVGDRKKLFARELEGWKGCVIYC